MVDTEGHDTVGSFGLSLSSYRVFDIDKSHLQLTVCPRYRKSFGITGRSNKRNCSAPISVKGERYYTLAVQTAIPLHCVSL